MKNFFKITLASILVIGSVSCDTQPLQDAIDDFGVLIGLEPINTGAGVLLVDAATGEFVNGSFTATLSGPNASDVVDMFSDPIVELSSETGVLNFGIRNEVVPSQENPATVILEITDESGQYIPKRTTLDLYLANEANQFVVEMVNRSNPPEGIRVQTQSAGSTANDGSTTQEVVVQTSTTAGTQNVEMGASITIPLGTRFVDASGQPLSGGLSSNTVYYHPDDSEALSALSEELFQTEAGSSFFGLGALDLQIRDASGRVASQVTGASKASLQNTEGIVVDFEIDPELLKTYEDAGANFVVQYEDESGQVVRENVSFITEKDKAGIELPQIQWRSSIFGRAVVAGAVIVENNNNEDWEPRVRRVEINLNGNSNVRGLTYSQRGTREYDVVLRPLGNFAFVTQYSPTALTFKWNGEVLNYTESGSTINITLPAPPSTVINATVNVAIECTGGRSLIVDGLPNKTILYRKLGTTASESKTATNVVETKQNGVLTNVTFNVSDVEQGETYIFTVTYEGQTESQNILISGTTVNYTQTISRDSVCD